MTTGICSGDYSWEPTGTAHTPSLTYVREIYSCFTHRSAEMARIMNATAAPDSNIPIPLLQSECGSRKSGWQQFGNAIIRFI
jgi:hypothetical protein